MPFPLKVLVDIFSVHVDIIPNYVHVDYYSYSFYFHSLLKMEGFGYSCGVMVTLKVEFRN